MRVHRTQLVTTAILRAVFSVVFIALGIHMIRLGINSGSWRYAAGGVVALVYSSYMVHWTRKVYLYLKAEKQDEDPASVENSVDREETSS